MKCVQEICRRNKKINIIIEKILHAAAGFLNAL
jgi:hypothetical protein